MSTCHKTALEIELGELFDIRSRKLRQQKLSFQEALDAKRDIKLLTRMFSEGISDMIVYINESETLEWDSKLKRLIYHRGELTQYIETASNDILIAIRPHLQELAKKAKEYYAG